MYYAEDLSAAIGNTPLIKLKKASEETGCTILGKAEFMNPGQSVKDRAALYIIKEAVACGNLRLGGTSVEGTAGNPGIGLARVGASMGVKTVIVIPDTQSQEKKDMIRLAGAELIEVPAVPYKNPNNYVRYSKRLAYESLKLSKTVQFGQTSLITLQIARPIPRGLDLKYGAKQRVKSTGLSVPADRVGLWRERQLPCSPKASNLDWQIQWGLRYILFIKLEHLLVMAVLFLKV